MKTNSYGEVVVNEQDVFSALYRGQNIDFTNCKFDDLNTVKQFNHAVQENADNIATLQLFEETTDNINVFDAKKQEQWFMPESYKGMDIAKWLVDQCAGQEELNRVGEELVLFVQHDMIDVLKYLKYLVDTMRQNNIVWGVGRGSSVASYCLYLLGVHKVDSIKYGLDIHEFLKET